MFFIILIVVLLVIATVFTLIVKLKMKEELFDNLLGLIAVILYMFCGAGALCASIALPVSYSQGKEGIAVFEQQKYYIEEVVPTLPDTDNYAITQKRVELNQWLYEIQYMYEHYRFFVFIPKDVMELEEIK